MPKDCYLDMQAAIRLWLAECAVNGVPAGKLAMAV